MNAHRTRWDGSICDSAASWNCGAEQYFREDYCERQVPRCFHMHAFDGEQPHFIIPHGGVGWLLDDFADALLDQVIVFWGPQFQEPRGIRETQPRTHLCFGAYRIHSVEKTTPSGMITYRLNPYPEGWVEFSDLHVPRPYYQSAGGTYVKQIERRALERLFTEALENARRVWGDAQATDPGHAERLRRLERFAAALPEWLDVAKTRAERFVKPILPVAPAPNASLSVPVKVGLTQNQPFRNEKTMKLLADKVRADAEPGATGTTTTVTASTTTVAKRSATTRRPTATVEPILEPLVEEDVADFIEMNYGSEVRAAVQVASLTKPIIGLRGEPGVGKSTLALNLLSDQKRERTLVVPVSSTWRGREDLLGYVSPIDNMFDPTIFTRFLIESQRAWDQHDHRSRIVIFEEFNLAQPEFWLSDILVRSQYPYSARRERTIDLGGLAIRGLEGVDPTGVYLSPALRFIATLNTDHTTRPLSPRVLDRLAIVELSLDPRRALERANVSLDEEQVEAISDLAFCLKNKGGTFSYRTAISLRACIDRLPLLEISADDALDLILQQEVLTKVRLMAGDPSDHQILRELGKWVEGSGSRFKRCGASIASWKEALEEGLDVTQA